MADISRRASMGLLASLAAACSPLATFNTLTPKDGGVVRAGHDIAFMDGPRGKLDVYAPRNASNAPVVFFQYGGSWNSGRRQDYAFAGRAIAAQGFVVVIADYRVVPEVVFPAFLQDGANAVKWVSQNIANYGGDPGQIILAGHSAGAYNAAMLTLDRSYLDAVGVSHASIRGLVGLSGPYDFYPWDIDISRITFGAWPDPLQTQPITFVRADAPPALLVTGSADTLVRPRNTRSLTAKLVEAGAKAESQIYDGVDHPGTLLALSRPLRGRAPVLEAFAGFARGSVQGAPAG
jgi:acetyl esterase/lipase